jgi:hypothetical protein
MKHFEYVTKKEYGPVKEELINLIRMVQDDELIPKTCT